MYITIIRYVDHTGKMHDTIDAQQISAPIMDKYSRYLVVWTNPTNTDRHGHRSAIANYQTRTNQQNHPIMYLVTLR